jgi:hypothetical protein
MDTSMVKQAGMQARSTVDEGATALMQQISGGVESGNYYNGLNAAKPNAQAFDENARAQLRALSQKLTGIQ